MANEPDMTAPITRGEMHEALDTWGGAIMAMIERLEAKLEAKLDAKFSTFASEMRALVNASETFVLGHTSSEIREVTKTMETNIIDRVVALLDPHKMLPDRVTKLEAAALPERVEKLETKVFAPKRRASKTGRRRS